MKKLIYTLVIMTALSTATPGYSHEGAHSEMDITINTSDVGGMYGTLAHIIHPMLLQFKEKSRSINSKAGVYNKDVPVELRTDDDYSYSEGKWYWVLDEMIHAFKSVIDNDPSKIGDREKNGFKLFGTYYQDLWL